MRQCNVQERENFKIVSHMDYVTRTWKSACSTWFGIKLESYKGEWCRYLYMWLFHSGIRGQAGEGCRKIRAARFQAKTFLQTKALSCQVFKWTDDVMIFEIVRNVKRFENHRYRSCYHKLMLNSHTLSVLTRNYNNNVNPNSVVHSPCIDSPVCTDLSVE